MCGKDAFLVLDIGLDVVVNARRHDAQSEEIAGHRLVCAAANSVVFLDVHGEDLLGGRPVVDILP